MALDALLKVEAAAYKQRLLAFNYLRHGKPYFAVTALRKTRSLKGDLLDAHLLRFAVSLTRGDGSLEDHGIEPSS